jgi:hypothetical protein
MVLQVSRQPHEEYTQLSDLAWEEVSDGLDCSPYRVRRLPRLTERRWQLEIVRRGSGGEGVHGYRTPDPTGSDGQRHGL